MHDSQSTTLARDFLTNDIWYLDLFLTSGTFSYNSTMLEVLSAVTGESIAAFEEVDFAEGSVKALKQLLAQKIGIPRFRLRLLQDNCACWMTIKPWSTINVFTLQVLQLVILELQLPDREQDQGSHGRMWGKWWQASWAAFEPTTKSKFWRCRCNDALVCGIL